MMNAIHVLTSLLVSLPALTAVTTPAPRVKLVAQAEKANAPLDMAAIKVPFGFNDDQLDVKYRDQLANAARCLKGQDGLKLTVTGHADERGTSEYNLALGERRAITVKNYLEGLGVPGARMRVVSYGEERPVSDGHDEAAWTANRRVEFLTDGTMKSGVVGCPDENAGRATSSADDDEAARKRREAEEEEARKRRLAEEEEARRRAAAAAAQANAAKADGGATKRMFPWLPIWVGPVVMAVSIIPLLSAIPFVVSMVYLGPSVFSSPSSCTEPLVVQKDGSIAGGRSDLMHMCGTAWSAAQHDQHRMISVPAVAVGVIGTLVFAGGAIATFAVGVGLLVAALFPASESQDAAPAPAAK
jgi:peptidoglycan-associated lipoprotein